MKNMIKAVASYFRWKGLVVFFLLLVALYLAVPLAIKAGLESALESSFDARSKVVSVDVDYSASKLTVIGVTVADKDAPMTNLFEWQSSITDLNFYAALTGRIVIDDMSIEGLKFGTTRSVSGLLNKPKKKTTDTDAEIKTEEGALDQEFSELASSGMKAMPSADVLLQREPLETVKLSQALSIYSKEKLNAWEQLEKDLPNKSSLHDYELEIKALKNRKIKSIDDFNLAKKELKQLKKKFKQDKQLLKDAKVFIQTAETEYTQQLKALKAAPEHDYKMLASKYKLSESGALNIAALLLGDQVKQVTEKGLSFYKKVKPIISTEKEENKDKERLKGHFIHYSAKKPSVWVKRLRFSGEYQQNAFEAEVTDISHQPELTQKPSLLNLTAKSLLHPKQLTQISGELDYRDATNLQESLDVKLSNYQINDWTIINDEKMTVIMKSGSLDVDADISRQRTLHNGTSQSSVNASANALFSQVIFNNVATNRFSQEVVGAIADVSNFDAFVTAKDSLDNVIITSNLDDQISGAINARLKKQQRVLENKLKQGINKNLSSALKNNDLSDLFSQEKSLDESMQSLEKLLDEELDSYSDEEKKKAKEKLKKQEKKLKGKLKSLFK